jgi:KRAB domain-containing zinc finger protein
MDLHEESHTGDMRFICDLCKYESKKIVQLKGHSRREHANIRQKCELCDFKANSKGSIQRHKDSEHEGKRVSCNLCDYVGKRLDGLKHHIKVEHERKRYNCHLCEFVAKSTQYLDHHVKVKHEGFRYECDQCDHKATQIGVLNVHKRKVHLNNIVSKKQSKSTEPSKETQPIILKDKPASKWLAENPNAPSLNCPDCLMTFSVPAEMRNHLKTEHNFIKCEHCFTVVRTKKLARRHTRISHTDLRIRISKPSVKPKLKIKRETTCSQCEYKTNTKATLDRHLNLKHGQGKVIKCSECDYETANRDCMKSHMDIHSGVDFPCDQCDYVGAQQNRLLCHIRYKHRTLPSKCSWPNCDYKARKDRLKIHVSFRHEGISHDCDKCDYKGATVHMLKAHVNQQHEESTLLKCDQCDHTSKNYGNLKKHQLHIHNTNRFSCEQCSFKTITKGILDGHIKSKHNYSSILSKFESKISTFDENTVSESWFECLICNKKFETKSQHTAHKKRCVKKDKLLNKCIKCSFTAETTKMIRSHFKIHESNKFSCNKCSYKTYSKSLMRRHKGLVHKEGNFLACSSCDFKTAANFLLRQHIARTHKNATFLCPQSQCQFETNKWEDLKAHKETSHEKVFHCSDKDCDHISNSISTATSHAKNMHGDKILSSKILPPEIIVDAKNERI